MLSVLDGGCTIVHVCLVCRAGLGTHILSYGCVGGGGTNLPWATEVAICDIKDHRAV